MKLEELLGFIVWLFALALTIGYFIYENKYYKSEQFANTKKKIQKYIDDCNELNKHIEELKDTYVNIEKTDFGNAIQTDNSNYNYKRLQFSKYNNNSHTYNCSINVCRNASQQPFKYLCKYFNIKTDEETLDKFEEVLNNFESAENGKALLKKQKEDIINSIWNEVPFIIKTIRKNYFINKLGFEKIDFSQLYFPVYSFVYISSGGNASMKTDIKLDINNLNKFVVYLSELVKFRKSVEGQRALMTSSLRQKIKERDKFTCQQCGNNIEKEPNLLLEIDHIVPLSKGGITSEDNLQTLCWKCNRSKGSKIIE